MTPRALLLSLTLGCVALLAPSAAYAAYNDVTLTTSASLSVGGYTLNVSGSSASIQSITVNADSFSVTLASGSDITVSSPSLQKLATDVTSDVTASACTDSASSLSLSYSGGSTVTNVITPSASICGASSSSSLSNSGSSRVGAILPGYTETNPLPGPSVVATSTGTAASASAAVPTAASSLTGAEIQAVVGLLASFGADQVTIAGVEAALSGTTVAPATAYAFSRDLKHGDTGDDVRALQAYLNAHGFAVAAAGPGSAGNETGYFGSATEAALARFQAANSIAPASGYFGSITRTFLLAGHYPSERP
ncbi:MAG TPA: peptidoglycan-binding domain-containing protein [Candidatus Paceibacterota bacterium]|nr:peptidoglycan-binding domain-containing protein [Candidatus Paceibacterota bacterium]